MRLHDPVERDPELGALLRALDTPPPDVDWDRLRGSIGRRAALDQARPRHSRFGWRRTVPVSLAASIALLFLLTRVPGGVNEAAPGEAAAARSIDAIFDADISDSQFRALLAGAADIDELLLLAASAADGS